MNYSIKKLIYKLKKEHIKKDLLFAAIFLIEWKYVLVNRKRLTQVEWFKSRNNYLDFNFEGKDLSWFLNSSFDFKNEKENDIDIEPYINFISNKTKEMCYTSFINLYYSTYPLLVSEKFDKIDLIKLRDDYYELVGNKNPQIFKI